jgi:hypothetical protein
MVTMLYGLEAIESARNKARAEVNRPSNTFREDGYIVMRGS